jgi:hypothetical protein
MTANARTENVERLERIDPQTHRRLLRFINDATRTEDLMYPPQQVAGHEEAQHEALPEPPQRPEEPLIDREAAEAILVHRDEAAPLGFLHIKQLFEIKAFHRDHLAELLHRFGHIFYGHWDTLPYDTQLPGGVSVDVGHAALLHTGKVLFIPADYSSVGWPTPIWDPSDEVNPQFEYPINNPAYSLFCAGHSFLSNGHLLVVGGGGDRNVTPSAVWGYRFDPTARTWTRTGGAMREYRWYPTAVTTGDHRVLVTCGNGSGHMEAYVEATDTFEEISGDTRGFPNLYPGMHLLPNHAVFFSRTGWGSAGAGTAFNDNRSAFFTFGPIPTAGTWTNVAAASLNRAKGMSVMIIKPTFPTVRIFVIGGVDSGGNGLPTAELFDASVLTAASSWSSPLPVPDGEARRQPNAVLLPDGTVFVSGGIGRVNSPCTLFDPDTNSWRAMDALPSIRGYHSVSLLLPSGKVLVAGGDGNPRIEVFSPPYLYRGSRPGISATPGLVHHGQTFSVTSPDAASITKVVLVRPMAVTHQTESEQRVLEMPFLHDHTQPDRLRVTAPHGGHPHSLAPQGYYLLFVLNGSGIPSVGRWIYLH